MKTHITPLFFFIILVSLISCSKNEDIQLMIKPFVGSYMVDGTAINGVKEFYDSTGQFIIYGYDTIQFENDTLEIRLQGMTDTLIMDGFRFAWDPSTPEGRREVQGVYEDGQINIIYDKSSINSRATITGFISGNQEEIEVDYEWNSTNYNSQAPPREGFIKAKGVKIE